MTHAFIGGFSGSKRSARRVADALAEYYDQQKCDFESLSFAEAMDTPEYTADVIRNRDLVTHSAGMLALKEVRTNSLTSIAPPIRTNASQLVVRGALKPLKMTLSAVGNTQRSLDVARVNVSQGAEFILHPIGNVSRLGEIAAYNSLEVTQRFHDVDIRFGYMTKDEFGFIPSSEDLGGLAKQRIAARMLDGLHDELILNPQGTIAQLDRELE